MSVLAAALSGIHLVPQSPPGKPQSPYVQCSVAVHTLLLISSCIDVASEEASLYCLFDYITDLLEKMVEQPGSALVFALTFLSLATTIPSIFRFAPAARLATVLERLGAYQLLFCIYLSPPTEVRSDIVPTPSDSTVKKERNMVDVFKATIASRTFGQAKEVFLGLH